MMYPVGSRVRFWCTIYSTIEEKGFWSYGKIMKHHPGPFKEYPYFIEWESYNGLGAWWSSLNPAFLELIKEPSDILKEIL